MTTARVPLPVAAAAGTACGLYMPAVLGYTPGGSGIWLIPLLILASAATVLPFRHRIGVVLMAAGIGLWVSALPLIMQSQEYLPMPAGRIAAVSGTVAADSRTARSGVQWFPLRLATAQSADGSRGSARGTVRVVHREPAAIAAGQLVTVEGSLSADGWLSADRLQPDGWYSQCAALRYRIRQRLLREIAVLNPATAGLAGALILGRSDGIDPEIYDLFQRTGMLHLLALSGMHLGILIGGPVLLLRRRVGVRPALLFGVFLVAGFIAVIGMRSSLMRAGTFFAVAAVWIASGRQVRPLTVLSQSFLVLVVLCPFLVQEVGFQLSYSAVAGILVFSPALLSLLRARLPSGGRPLYAPVAAGIGASVGGLPIVAAVWGVWYPLGIVLTVFAVPVVTLVMYLCIILIAGYAAMVSPVLLAPLEAVVALMVDILAVVLQQAAGQLQLPLQGVGGSILWIAVFLACVLLALRYSRRRRQLCEASCITTN